MEEICNLRFWGTVRGLLCGVALAAGGFLGHGQAQEALVDREILILVDVTKSVTDAEFAAMMSGYAAAFESSSVIAAVESGDLGSIAASVVFYSDKKNQAVGVDWMEISDATEAGSFADQLRMAGRPFDKNKASIAEGMDFAVPLFGTETGGAPNGFESTYQVMTVTGEGVDDHSPKTGGSRDATVAAARDAALMSGVDVIDALTLGAVGSVDAYFAQYVVGGSVNGTAGQVQNVASFAEFDSAAASQLQASIPEPVAAVGVLMGIGLLGWRRNRESSGN